MDVTEQVKAWRDLGNPCAQIGAAGATADGRAIAQAAGRRVRDEDVDAGRDQ